LTWSERQALAKKQQGEEEARSRSAAYVTPAASPVSKPVFQSSAPAFGRATVSRGAPKNFGVLPSAGGLVAAAGATAAVGAAAAVGVSTADVKAARDAVQEAAWGTEEEPEPGQSEHEQPEPEQPAEVEEDYEPPVCLPLLALDVLFNNDSLAATSSATSSSPRICNTSASTTV
jgi:hypothetical protein